MEKKKRMRGFPFYDALTRRRDSRLPRLLVPDEWRGWIATVVVSNGLAYHGAAHWNAKTRDVLFWWDGGCNAALCTFINVASTVQPWTGTALAVAGWPFGWLAGW